MNLQNTKVKTEFLSSMSFKTHSLSTNKYTVESDLKHLNGLIFYSETTTQKTDTFHIGVPETEYYINGSEQRFKTPLELVESIKQ